MTIQSQILDQAITSNEENELISAQLEAIEAIDLRVASSIKTSKHYQHYHSKYNRFLEENNYGRRENIDEFSSRNIRLLAIQNGQLSYSEWSREN